MTPSPLPPIKILDAQHFTVRGWLVDLVLIEHWSRSQGAGKFHGIRNALGVLQRFTQQAQAQGGYTPQQAQRMIAALQRLADYGYHIPSEVL